MTCKDTIDLILSFLTLLLSIIAISVSVYTVRKQNKLQLFDKRYEVFCKLNFLISVARQITENKNNSEKNILLVSRKSYIEVSFPNEQAQFNSDLKTFYHNLCLSTISIKLLFPKKDIRTCDIFLETFKNYYIDEIDDKNTTELKKQLSAILKQLDNNKELNTLEKYITIG